MIIVQIGDQQIGLLADRVLDIVAFESSQVQPVPTVVRNGRTDVEVWAETTGLGGVALRHGGRYVHNVYAIGFTPDGGDTPLLGLGIGFHRPLGGMMLDLDAMAWQTQMFQDGVGTLTQARASLALDLGPVAAFVSVAYNVSVEDRADMRPLRTAFAQGAANAMSMRWTALADAANVVATLAGLEPERTTSEVRNFPALVRDAEPWRREQAENGIADLAAVMEPGMAALLALRARGAEARPAAMALWREFVSARAAILSREWRVRLGRDKRRAGDENVLLTQSHLLHALQPGGSGHGLLARRRQVADRGGRVSPH